jgi:hypothetical protein
MSQTLSNSNIIDSQNEIPPGDGVSVASIGSENTFVSLHIRYYGEVIVLNAELTIYYPCTSVWNVEEVGRTFCDDEDDALNAAIDLQRAAKKRLGELDVHEAEIYSDPDDYPEALEKHFDRARTAIAVAAE